MKNSPLKGLSLLALLVLAGCGGHHHGGTDGGTTFATDIKLTIGTGYNGASGDLTGTPTDTISGGSVMIKLVDGIREFDATIPVTSLSAGTTITPGTTGVSLTYSETMAGTDGTLLKAWTATGGSVTITTIANGKADVTVDGLQFSPTNSGGNNAAGTFTAEGKVVGIPLVAN